MTSERGDSTLSDSRYLQAILDYEKSVDGELRCPWRNWFDAIPNVNRD